MRGAGQAGGEETYGGPRLRVGQHHGAVRAQRGEPHRRHGEGHGVP